MEITADEGNAKRRKGISQVVDPAELNFTDVAPIKLSFYLRFSPNSILGT